mgnify:CR=1 FL=1
MQSAEELLKKYWGYDEFLHPQKEIIEAVLSGADTLAIMPTGGGKSLCYQLPSLMLDGLTLVISPLIALMQDQIQNLNEKGIPAAAISSQLSKDEIATVISRCSLGKIKLLYISPERLQSRFFLQSLQHLHVSRIAVDEAHCISQWGHDFRPSYLRIHLIREMFPEVNMLALTATAHPKTVLEIISALKLKNSKIFKKSLKRENLTYKITRTLNELDDLVYVLKKHAGAGIVFVRTRRKSYETAEFLKASGFNAEFFHAGLPKDEKAIRQQIWTESSDQIMVATNAFGMGIDKADVRLVIHLNLPDSLEAYVQEAGRAGRDGKNSEAILFVSPNEIEDLEAIFKNDLPNKNEFEKTERSFYNYFEIGENERPNQQLEFDFNEFVNRFELNKKKAEKTLRFLERKEVIARRERSVYSSVRVYGNPKHIQISKSLRHKILEILVRKYPGISSGEKAIVEFHIATELKQPIGKIKKQLKKLSEAGYIHYRSREIQLVEFKRPRESNYIKNILWKEFEKFQQLRWKRLQDMIYYATQDEVCREKLILRYFGEKPKENCGNCDQCFTGTDQMHAEKILEFMGDDSKTISEILYHFIEHSKEAVLDAMEQLSDEGIIINSGIDSYRKK